ncbi:hypothetical protein ARMGADRAFT_423598 [Armillaria gallica]|uniref:Uncharacterized protein n=1 Tax=Armillaria gallica TaxID=47427 RepID=A0A2H3E1N4_ARMGA|nr:hypothetical protein ARMGADRAFT_423598 [Armillaria gallica]
MGRRVCRRQCWFDRRVKAAWPDIWASKQMDCRRPSKVQVGEKRVNCYGYSGKGNVHADEVLAYMVPGKDADWLPDLFHVTENVKKRQTSPLRSKFKQCSSCRLHVGNIQTIYPSHHHVFALRRTSFAPPCYDSGTLDDLSHCLMDVETKDIERLCLAIRFSDEDITFTSQDFDVKQ